MESGANLPHVFISDAKTNIRDYHGKVAAHYWRGSAHVFERPDLQPGEDQVHFLHLCEATPACHLTKHVSGCVARREETRAAPRPPVPAPVSLPQPRPAGPGRQQLLARAGLVGASGVTLGTSAAVPAGFSRLSFCGSSALNRLLTSV